jgi:hypothetical protein
MGFCDSEIVVHVAGGIIDTTVSDDFSISMIGVYLIVEMKKLVTF